MKLLEFSFNEKTTGWKLETIRFRDGLNLFVGASGAGKSRIFNALSNLAKFARSSGAFLPAMQFHMKLVFREIEYTWEFDSVPKGKNFEVATERITRRPHNEQEASVLIDRTQTGFKFEQSQVPKLAKNQSAINLLKEEALVAPLFEAFGLILLRSFYASELGNAVSIGGVLPDDSNDTEAGSNETKLPPGITSINVRLAYLRAKSSRKLGLIFEQFKKVFPFVDDLQIREVTSIHNINFGRAVPLVELREKKSHNFVPITDISSGMQKVLFLITDVIAGDPEDLLLIEEYENSLGINAINFLPDFLLEFSSGRQVFVTSHHPQLINSVPITDWFVVSRDGTNIHVAYGDDLEKRYGTSRHTRFTQLINDPIYKLGIE